MNKHKTKLKRARRVRAKMKGTKSMPRLSVFRSNKQIYAQLIDDTVGMTLLGISEIEVKLEGKPIDKAKAAGMALAKKALEKKIKKVVFDRGGNAYHGRVKAFAEGAREGGLRI